MSKQRYIRLDAQYRKFFLISMQIITPRLSNLIKLLKHLRNLFKWIRNNKHLPKKLKKAQFKIKKFKIYRKKPKNYLRIIKSK